MQIKEKILDLFELRRLPILLEEGGLDLNSEMYLNLVELQKAIYELDSYLESNWNLESSKLDTYWKAIYRSLDDFGVPENSKSKYLQAILKYQKHELQLRSGKLPIDYTLEYFYYYKSCDVKLIRSLIYEAIPSLEKLYPLSDWRLFDLVTEIYDDIEDVFEDIDVYNGNSFLLNINSRGLESTVTLFQEFINDIEWRLDEKYANAKKTSKLQLYHWTKEAIMHLNILLLKQADLMRTQPIKESKVIRKLSLELSL